LVILDSLNYIKGFRYELHCISKAAGTKHGVIWLICNEDKVTKWNEKRSAKKENYYYTKEMMDELITRYEPPDQRNRWDRPLYRVDVNSTLEEENNDNVGEDNQDGTGKAAEKVLKKSVYNMHSLSDAIKDVSQSTTITSSKQMGSSSFKRVTTTNTPSTVSTIIKTGGAAANVNTASSGRGGFRRIAPRGSQRSTDADDIDINKTNETTGVVNATSNIANNEQVPSSKVEKKREKKQMEQLIDAILDSFLLDVEPLKEGQSTKLSKAASSNVLNDVDSVSQDIVSSFLVAQQSSSGGGGGIVVPIRASEGKSFTLQVNRTIQIGEMKRLRRQYITWVKDNPPRDTSYVGIATSFLSFVQNQL
jgi:tRNA uridine 5-carbamoylmethylation protein Kti12